MKKPRPTKDDVLLEKLSDDFLDTYYKLKAAVQEREKEQLAWRTAEAEMRKQIAHMAKQIERLERQVETEKQKTLYLQQKN